MPTPTTSARRHQFGITVTPMSFGAVGDGVADDTAAWAAFQSATGVKSVPPGRYLVNGAVKRFDAGCFGNGEFIDGINDYDDVSGDRERDALIVHHRTINANSQLVSSNIKMQTLINYEVPSPSQTFKRIINGYQELTINGFYNTQTDQQNNFTNSAWVTRNNMAGKFGSVSGMFYISDATEVENPLISTMGATKSGGIFINMNRRARYASDGYMFGMEIIATNESLDSDIAVPYENNDFFNFTSWTAALKLTGRSNSAPITTALLVTGDGDSIKHGLYNGIVIGASCWWINGDRAGPAGTIGINMAGWRDSAGFPDIGLKFRAANRHTYFAEPHKSRAAKTRFMHEAGDCSVSIEAQSGSLSAIEFKTGATSAANGGALTTNGKIDANPARIEMLSTDGEARLNAAGSIYSATGLRFAPAVEATGTKHLGGSNRRWAEGWINTPIFAPGVGVTLTPAKNGDLMIETTSNTAINIKLRGTDGIVRSATINLS